jgi:hypothetical protein
MIEFVEVEVEPGPASEDGVSMRWRQIDALRSLEAVVYENDDGLAGEWRCFAIDDPDGVERRAALVALVEDSSDGAVLLIVGGRQGLVLEHGSGVVERQPYLLLSRMTRVR